MTSTQDNTQNKMVAVVSGSSSGIGLQTSLTLARNGFLTYATMRNLKKAETVNKLSDKEKISIKVIQLDVTDDKSVYDAIQTIISEAGRIDVLVNNAGHGFFGAFEDCSIEEIKDLYETNLFGLVRLTQEVLPTMRRQQ
jgi:NADP-dependent 3-hydroxy acid dehydrogenase YdfG